MRKHLSRVSVVTAAGLALTCTPFSPASASTVEDVIVTVAGQPVTVGSTVATGQLVNGLCQYDDAAVALTGTASTATVRLTALDDCRLVATVIEAVDSLTAPGSAAPTRQVEKVEMNPWASSGGTGGVGGVGIIGDAGGGGLTPPDAPDVDGALALLAGKAENWGQYHGSTTQRFVSPAGFVQWEDEVGMIYTTAAGELVLVGKVGNAPSYCGVYDAPDSLVTPNHTDAAQCAMWTSSEHKEGMSWVSTKGWGRYYQGLPLAGELYATHASERFTAYGFSGYVGECDRSFVPPRWSVDCTYASVAVKAT